MYSKGKHDLTFVAFYTIVLSFTREFLMQRVIRPWAVRCGIRGRAKQFRFMEQAYTAIYFAVFGPLGIYIMSRGPLWYFNTTAMFDGFPHKQHEGIFKAYYLLQASYWSQQAVVLLLQLEKPRKDFRELVLHHIVTLALIALSYRFHFVMMGLAVYITHDISDFFLAVSFAVPLHPCRPQPINADPGFTLRPPRPSTTSTTHWSAPTLASSSASGSICVTTSTSPFFMRLSPSSGLLGPLSSTGRPSSTNSGFRSTSPSASWRACRR